MAAREGQGLQIAVIIFAMLTIILAITTYMFYAQAQTATRERDNAVKQRTDDQATINKLLYRVAAMKYVLGLPNATKQDVEFAAGKAGGEDTEVKELLAKFDADMAAIGDQLAQGEAKNYGTLAKILLNAVNIKNSSVADTNEQMRKAQAERDAVAQREKGRADTAETGATSASKKLADELAKFEADRKQLQDANEKIAASLGERETRAKTDIEKLAKEKDDLDKGLKQARLTISNLQKKIEELTAGEQIGTFDKPDGKVVTVNQGQRLVWIDLGRADGVQRQMTFAIYDADVTSIGNAKPKARIEVVQVTGDHLSEARILEDKVTNLIRPGDVVFSASWSPGERVHFALSGKMDVNNDRIDDYNLIRNVILLNGGEIDAELKPDGTRTGTMSVNTRYFVLGEKPDDSANPNAIKAFSDMEEERARNGVQIISPKELLSMMGWRAEERTVELGGRKGGDFQLKGKAAPGSGAPAAAPATSEATPPAAEGGTPATDPFAAPSSTPAAPAAPATEADPFAAPR